MINILKHKTIHFLFIVISFDYLDKKFSKEYEKITNRPKTLSNNYQHGITF